MSCEHWSVFFFTCFKDARGALNTTHHVHIWVPLKLTMLPSSGIEKWKVQGRMGAARARSQGLEAKGCWVLFTRAKVHSDHLGQSVPDVVNDTLLDPDLTRALCILHYQTPGSLKLHYLQPPSPPYPTLPTRNEKKRVWEGKLKGNLDLTPSHAQRVPFPSGQADTLCSASHHVALFRCLFSSWPCVLCCEPVTHNNIRVLPGTPKMILPAGIFREI